MLEDFIDRSWCYYFFELRLQHFVSKKIYNYKEKKNTTLLTLKGEHIPTYFFVASAMGLFRNNNNYLQKIK